MDKKKQTGRIYYGWHIVLATFMILCFNAGARYAQLRLSLSLKSSVGVEGKSLVFFVNMVIFGVSLLIVGKLYDRYGPKWVIIISTIFISAGFILTSLSTPSVSSFSYGILAAFGIAGTAVPLMATLTSKWL